MEPYSLANLFYLYRQPVIKPHFRPAPQQLPDSAAGKTVLLCFSALLQAFSNK